MSADFVCSMLVTVDHNVATLAEQLLSGQGSKLPKTPYCGRFKKNLLLRRRELQVHRLGGGSGDCHTNTSGRVSVRVAGIEGSNHSVTSLVVCSPLAISLFSSRHGSSIKLSDA